MPNTKASYDEILEEVEDIESYGHLTAKGQTENFIKLYRDDSEERQPNRFFSIYKKMIDGEPMTVPGPSEKAENVEELANAQDEIGINHAGVIFRDGNYSEYEFIPGNTLDEELEDLDEIGELGRTIGEMTKNLHENDFARYDNRTSNIIIDDSGIISDEAVPYLIDSEYVQVDADEGDKNLGLVSFIDSINDMAGEDFKKLFEGFRDGYGKIPKSTIALSGLRTTAERTLEGEFLGASRAVKNTLTAFYYNSTSIDHEAERHENPSSGMGIPSGD